MEALLAVVDEDEDGLDYNEVPGGLVHRVCVHCIGIDRSHRGILVLTVPAAGGWGRGRPLRQGPGGHQCQAPSYNSRILAHDILVS